LQGRIGVLGHLPGFVDLILPDQSAAEQNLGKISLAGHGKLLVAGGKRPFSANKTVRREAGALEHAKSVKTETASLFRRQQRRGTRLG
jgi:hypothetical protein